MALYDELVGEDVTIIAPPNPLRGLSGGDGEYLKGVIKEIDGPVLLVGHSYGGSVITAAGTADNVVGLVYISGFAPDEGENLTTSSPSSPRRGSSPTSCSTTCLMAARSSRWHLGASTSRSAPTSRLPMRRSTPYPSDPSPVSPSARPASTPAWRSRPVWGVFGTADRCIDPGVHRFSYDRMGATVTEVEGASHVVMISHPKEVAEVVMTAVRKVS